MSQPPILFSDTVRAVLAGQAVGVCYGVKLLLANETLSLSQGTSFVDNTGNRWQGLGDLGQISGLQLGPEAATAPLILTLSGLASTLAMEARASNEQIRGRMCQVYMHILTADFDPLDLPYLVQVYTMDNAKWKYSGAGQSCIFEIKADPVFSAKSVSPLSLLSNADQQERFPNDLACIRTGWKHTVVTQSS